MTAPNPYRIEGPALISFSGGRTSGYMLWHVLDAHGGQLPEDVHVCFANTGKEREETLRFVHNCAVNWGVRVRWVELKEWSGRETPWADRFEEVGFNSASRLGEPMKIAIAKKGFLPNAVTRFCTTKTKIETMKHFMLAQGHMKWTNAIGLRRDEMHRVFKQIERNEAGKERWITVMPMATKEGAKAKADIWRFWLGDNADPKRLIYPLPQGFDLGLYPYEGNCDDCMLKGFDILVHQERERPGTARWWSDEEIKMTGRTRKPDGARFVTEYSYEDVIAAAQQPLLIPLDWRTTEYDAECGLWCAGDAKRAAGVALNRGCGRKVA